MELKEFMEQVFKDSPMAALGTAEKLLQLEHIENYLNLMWGINLDIKIVPAEQHEGRFYGKGVIDKVAPKKE